MKIFAIASACFAAAASLQAQITYVEATNSNTTRVDGNPFAPSTAAQVYSDSNWTVRDFASGGKVFEGGGGEAVPALKQTVTGVTPGTYEVDAFFWVGDTFHWQINAGLASNSTSNFYGTSGTSTFPAATTSLASAATYAGNSVPTLFREADRTMIRAKLGQVTVDATGVLRVFVNPSPTFGGSASNSRIWFDGIGYSAYVEPPPAPLPGNSVEIAPDGAYTWFDGERSILHQGSLYCGYVKSNGQFGITRRNLATGENSHMIISTTTSQEQDDHDSPSITELPDGKLLLVYSKHSNTSPFYQRTSLVSLPSSNADWGPEITVTTPTRNTYANTYRLTGESNAIYNFSRCINFNPTLTISTNNGATWGTFRQFIATGSGETRPYTRFCSNGTDRIDLIYTDGHPRDVNNSVYHLFYKNGGLYKTDGTLIKNLANIPLNHDAGERGSVVYPYSAATWSAGNGPDDWIPTGRGWTWDVQYGPGETPVCVFQVQRDGATWSDDRIYYYYARWNGTQWQRKFIAQAGRPIYSEEDDYGGGMCLDPEDPRIVYFASNAANPFALGDIDNVPLRANNRYEIYRGFTADGGLTFTWSQITVNSTVDNLRPLVPPHHGGQEFLLWFSGTYNSYTSYSTRVLGRIGVPVISYVEWAAGYGLTANSGPDDPDHDGIKNLVENVFGTAPNAATPGLTQIDSTATSVTFKHPLNPNLASDVTYTYQWSSDLSEWKTSGQTNTGGTTVTIAAGAPVAGIVTVTGTISGGPATRLFVRLVATQAP